MKLIPQVLPPIAQPRSRTVLAPIAALFCLMAAAPESRAQNPITLPPSAVPPAATTPKSVPPTGTDATHSVRYAFYVAASRSDLAEFLEYRYLATGGVRDLWPTDFENGSPAISTAYLHGITRPEFESELAKRRTAAEALLSSGRVIAQLPQKVRLVQKGTPDFSAWETADRQGIRSYAARGVRHETMRIVELLEGPQKGQHVWTTAMLSRATEPERMGWSATMRGDAGGSSATGNTVSGPVPGAIMQATNVGLVYDAEKRVNVLQGKVTNTTEQAVEDVEVEVAFTNQGGAVVYHDRAVSASRLDPGQVWTFSVPFPGLETGATGGHAVSVKATPFAGSNTTAAPVKSKYK